MNNNFNQYQIKMKTLLNRIINLIKLVGVKTNRSYIIDDFNFYYKDKVLKVTNNKEILTILEINNELITNLNDELINKIDMLLNYHELKQQVNNDKEITKRIKL